jgi:hypothetical protein
MVALWVAMLTVNPLFQNRKQINCPPAMNRGRRSQAGAAVFEG